MHLFYPDNLGRSGEIRTHGLYHPKVALYQAEPRPDNEYNITKIQLLCQYDITK
mgnify:CR=1 FL=1